MVAKKRSILIVLIAGIGDLILASKSMRAIKNRFLETDLHLLTSSEAAPIASNFPFVDYVWSFPVRQLKLKRLSLIGILKLVTRLRRIQFHFVINLYRIHSWSGALKMGILFSMLKAKSKIGHDTKGFGWFLHKKAPKEIFQKRHVADAMAEMANLAGGISDETGIEICWNETSEERHAHLFAEINTLRIGINPGGYLKNKRWNPARFAELADRLIEVFKATIIILGGPGEERIARQIVHRMEYDAMELAGKLQIQDLPYIISKLDILITNDSGPMHVGAAVGTPIVALFGPGDPQLFGPYTSPDKYIVIHKPTISTQPASTISNMDGITASEVFHASKRLLSIHHPASTGLQRGKEI